MGKLCAISFGWKQAVRLFVISNSGNKRPVYSGSVTLEACGQSIRDQFWLEASGLSVRDQYRWKQVACLLVISTASWYTAF